MSFTLQNDGFKMETKWDKLAIPNFSKSPRMSRTMLMQILIDMIPLTDQEADEEPHQDVDGEGEEVPTFSVSISLRNLLKFLATNLANTTTIACKST